MNRTATRITIYAGTAVGVLWLPFHVKPFPAIYSISQAFHFNNQVALVALLAGLALATWWSWPGETAAAPGRSPQQDRQLGCWPLLAALAVSSIELTLISLASGWYPMDSAAYFINRLLCIQDGLIPYRDFEFAGGPAMLYIPVVLRRLTGLSVDAAYLAALWLFAWGGLFLLWWVIRQSSARRLDKTMAFLVLAAYPALNPEFGLEYTMTRYICGFAALVAARIAVEKLAGRWFLVAVCHFLLSAAVLSISPEIGGAFLAALVVYWLLEYRAGSKWLAYTAAMHLSMLACLALLAPRNTWHAIRGFAVDGNDLPLFPSPYVLLYLGSLLIAVAPLLADAIDAAFHGPGQQQRLRVFGTLTGAFAVHAVAMMPGALARPDASHVLYNGTGVFLLTLLAPLRMKLAPRAAGGDAAPPPKRRGHSPVSGRLVYQVALLLTAVVSVTLDRGYMLPGLKYLATLRAAAWSEDHPSSALADGVEEALGAREWNRLRRNLLGIQQRSLENLFPGLGRYGKICDPLGLPEIYSVLAHHHALRAEYYYSAFDESTALAIQRKVNDVRSCAFVILPRDALLGLPPLLPLDQDYYSRLLMFPLWGSPKFPLPPPKRELLKYVKASFVPLQQVIPGMYLCMKRPGIP